MKLVSGNQTRKLLNIKVINSDIAVLKPSEDNKVGFSAIISEDLLNRWTTTYQEFLSVNEEFKRNIVFIKEKPMTMSLIMSNELFGTTIFANSFMQTYIGFGNIKTMTNAGPIFTEDSDFNIGLWTTLLPDVYKNFVMVRVNSILQTLLSRKLSKVAFKDEFIVAIQQIMLTNFGKSIYGFNEGFKNGGNNADKKP